MDLLAQAAADHPDAPALVTDGRVLSYRELDTAATGVADLILASGTLGSHAVAFWGDRSMEAVAAVWGIPRAGVAAVPVDPRTPPGVAMEATRSAGVRGLWAPPGGGVDHLIERGAGRSHDGRGEYVVLTSGSEGTPKGVRLTPANIAASVAASRERLGHDHDDAWLCVLPLFHVGGLSILWRQAASAAPVVLHETFDADAVAVALGEVAFASFVPVMLRRVLASGGRGHSGLKGVLIGGAASDPTVLAAARDRGIPATPTYGMTETCSQIATARPGEPLDGTVGWPLDGAAIRIVRDGEVVVGQEGTIEVSGAMVSPGYAGEEPRGVGSWFRTGDMGIVDGTGRLTVVGRADAVIVTGGENVHPLAVEAALRGQPGIEEVRVFGVPDAEWGMVVAAEVETRLESGALDALAADLPAPMRPRRWDIVPQVRRKLDG